MRFWPGDGGPRWRLEFLGGAVFGPRRMGGGDTTSDRRSETKEERAKWAANARWAVSETENENKNGVGFGCPRDVWVEFK
jgi:hypothetical protein